MSKPYLFGSPNFVNSNAGYSPQPTRISNKSKPLVGASHSKDLSNAKEKFINEKSQDSSRLYRPEEQLQLRNALQDPKQR